MMRLLLLAALIALAASVGSAPDPAHGKGQPYIETFRLSGGDLPHSVTVTLEEYVLAVSGQGSWFEEYGPGVSAPPADAARYRLEIVQLDRDATIVDNGRVEEYVSGSPPRMTSDGAWAIPVLPVRSLLDRYIALGRAGALPERPTLAQSLMASATVLGASISFDGVQLPTGDADRALRLVSGAQAVVFGVQGSLVGQRDLSRVQLDFAFGEGRMSATYIPPGPIAPLGILMPLAARDSWAISTLIDPPGYWQTALTLPDEFDRFMAERGHRGYVQGDIVANRIVPLLQARMDTSVQRLVLLKDGQMIRELAPQLLEALCSDCGTAQLAGSFEGEALALEVWNAPVDPFPEAIRPGRYEYYPPGESGESRGVVVQTQTAAVANVTFGDEPAPPFYATEEIDREVERVLAAAITADEKASGAGLSGLQLTLVVTALAATGLGFGALTIRRWVRRSALRTA